MKSFIAGSFAAFIAIVALGAAPASADIVGAHVGPVGVHIGPHHRCHYYYHHHHRYCRW